MHTAMLKLSLTLFHRRKHSFQNQEGEHVKLRDENKLACVIIQPHCRIDKHDERSAYSLLVQHKPFRDIDDLIPAGQSAVDHLTECLNATEPVFSAQALALMHHQRKVQDMRDEQRRAAREAREAARQQNQHDAVRRY